MSRNNARSLHTGGDLIWPSTNGKSFSKAYPDDPLAAQAQFYAGVCYLSLKDKQYDKARDAFEKVIAKYPKFEQLNNAYFNLGLCDYNLAQAGKPDLYAKAADAFGQLITQFPKSPQVAEALYYRGESLYAEGKKDDAVQAWSQLVTGYPQSPVRPRALYNLGLTQAELGKQDAAGATFDTFLKDFPQHELASEVYIRKADTLLAAEQIRRRGADVRRDQREERISAGRLCDAPLRRGAGGSEKIRRGGGRLRVVAGHVSEVAIRRRRDVGGRQLLLSGRQ